MTKPDEKAKLRELSQLYSDPIAYERRCKLLSHLVLGLGTICFALAHIFFRHTLGGYIYAFSCMALGIAASFYAWLGANGRNARFMARYTQLRTEEVSRALQE